MSQKSEDIGANKVRLINNVFDNLKEIYSDTIQILEEGIKAGKTNVPLGLMSFVAYIDLLHGGAYQGKVEDLPYYGPKEMQPDLNIPMNAKPEQVEALLNSDVPHIFPKVLSDQAYFLLKEWASLFFTEALVAGASTSLTTLVEAPGRLVKPFAEMKAGEIASLAKLAAVKS